MTVTGGYAVTMIGTLPPLKGISPYCAEQALALAQETGVEFVDFKHLYPDRLYPGGTVCDDLYPIELDHPNLKIRKLLSWKNPLTWIWAGLTFKGEVVHAQWWSYPLAPIYLVMLGIARLRRKKVVLTVHNVYPHEKGRIKKLLNSAVLPLADILLVHSEDNREALIALGWDPEKVSVTPHHSFRYNRLRDHYDLPFREASRESLGVEERHKLLCFFGNIREYKGLDNLLLALDILKDDFPEMNLVIAGQPWEGWEKYDEIIREAGISNRIILKDYFLPFEELATCLRASDLVVFPFKELHCASDSASLALSMGCDILSTIHLDIEGGDRAHYTDGGRPAVLAAAITDFFNGDRVAGGPREVAGEDDDPVGELIDLYASL